MTISKYLLAVVASAALVACGGGSDGTTVAADVAPVAVNPTTGAAATQALAGKPLSYASGVPSFGTAGTATTLTVAAPAAAGAAPTFGVSAGGNTASGDLTFGSCIFVVKASTFAAAHPLALGKTVTVTDCAIDFNTANVEAEGGSATVSATLTLGTATSAPITTTVVIESDGDILVNGTKITTATVTTVTGGS